MPTVENVIALIHRDYSSVHVLPCSRYPYFMKGTWRVIVKCSIIGSKDEHFNWCWINHCCEFSIPRMSWYRVERSQHFYELSSKQISYENDLVGFMKPLKISNGIGFHYECIWERNTFIFCQIPNKFNRHSSHFS